MQNSVCASTPSDSLRNIINTTKSDSLKIMAFTQLTFSKMNNPTEALEIISEMVRMGAKLKDQKLQALCTRKVGTLYHRLNFFDKALEYYINSAEIFRKLNDKDGMANCYNNMANAYATKGELTANKKFYERAIEYHLNCIKLRREAGDTSQLSNSYNNIGIVYMYKGEFALALENFNKAFKIYSLDKAGLGGIDMVILNLGDVYLKMAIKEQNREYFDKAMFYFKDRLNSYRTGGANDRHITVLARIGQILCETGQCREATKFLKRANDMAKQIRNNSSIMESSYLLSHAMEQEGDFATALEYMKLYNQTKDSLINERNTISMEQMQALYESSQKDRAIELLSQDNELQALKVNKQRIALFSMLGGLVLLALLGMLIFNRYNIKRKANLELARAYQKIEMKNNQITDSINYARRIQSAILPPQEFISAHLKNFFVLYKPKDIVSGDFYWFTHHLGKSFFAVADCTGHGVPGALMSMIGNTLLNEIVNQKDIVDPAEILYRLNEGVIKALRQSGVDIMEQDDGMDISLCCIDDKNKLKLSYASANLSIFINTEGVLTELKGDIFSVGGGIGSSGKMFQTKNLELKEGSAIIMSTDGYYDQFGGKDNSKFLVSKFEETISGINFSEVGVKEKIEAKFENWKGSRQQTDDVLVTGFVV